MPTFQTLLTGSGGVRSLLNDEDSTNYRHTDNELIQWANEALYEIALRRPDLFARTGDITCTAGEVHQSAPTRAIALLDILRVKTSSAITKVDRTWLDHFLPTWTTDTAGPAVHWAPDKTSPIKFFIYPKAPNPQTLTGIWAEVQQDYVIGDTVPLQGYDTLIKNYVIFRAESVDDESVNTQRAAAFFAQFERTLGVSAAIQGASKVAKDGQQ
jgi:hypothetical protein